MPFKIDTRVLKKFAQYMVTATITIVAVLGGTYGLMFLSYYYTESFLPFWLFMLFLVVCSFVYSHAEAVVSIERRKEAEQDWG